MDLQEKLAKGKETVAFRITNVKPDYSDYAEIVVDVVYVREGPDYEKYQFGFYDNYCDQKHQYKGLKVKAQMDKERELPYSYRLIVHNLDEIDLQKAEEMVKTLRPINRKLDKLDQAEGYVESFEEYIVRLGRVLGVKAFFTKFDSEKYSLHADMSRLRSNLRTIIRQNQEALGYVNAA